MIEHRELRSICHASLGTKNVGQAKAFYQPLLKTLAIELVCEYEHAVAFGKGGYPEFWLQIPFDKKMASQGNGVHFGFVATSQEQVDNFYQQALALGAKDNGKPGERPEYGDKYYGCFVLDLEGNKIEACYWKLSD
ncbi:MULTISPECIES: VOC family protein [Thalassotalea]|uniref:VOC family protein n=1 Tax=Thalassotalea castellviae TaxID=3075612 RepID=A0ABU3A0D7_9GAMM|nr:VOC family protein [Thalassotalea sp. W431]MDT0603641.1 VOC family protein [Thalassotalea sp. W431]